MRTTYSRIVLTLMAISILLTPTTVQAQDPEADDELTTTLSEMADLTQTIADAYPQAVADGDIVDQQAYDRAQAAAEQIAAAFGAEESDTEFEKQLQEISLPLGEQIEGQVYRLANMIEGRRAPAEVQALLDELAPNFNRAVLLAKGKIAPIADRQLKNEQAIANAVAEVEATVDEAVAVYRDGDAEEAANLANEAFFLYESNGLGADTTVIDEQLENRVESQISNFANPDEDPGLEQLISNGASIEAVEEQAQAIKEGLSVNQSLLVGTLPDVLRGDVNGDGRVTIVDALFIARAAVNLREVDAAAADANGDGTVSIVDALLVAQAAVGLRSL